MRREDLEELHYITPINNIPSIIQHGIVSHKLASQMDHDTVALQEVQERRKNKRIPTGKWLHDYANLYICARNPMMYKRRNLHHDLCVLQISPEVLDIHGAIVVDRNSSSDYAAFYPSPEGLSRVNGELVFSEYWTHPEDQFFEWEHKSIKCAEILIPNRVPLTFIFGAYVSGRIARNRLIETGFEGIIEIDEHMFFARRIL
jgi:hypothetical protein